MNRIQNQFTTDAPTLLYGGAISAQLPAGLLDASHIRPVPDTQEVFVSPTPDAPVVSVIVDLLEYADGDTIDAILDAHAEELGLTGVPHSATTAFDQVREPLVALGGYRTYRPATAEKNRTGLCVGVLRLAAPATSDVVLTFTGIEGSTLENNNVAGESSITSSCASFGASFSVLEKSLFG